MTICNLTDYCLSKSGAVLDYPFGPEPAVFKVGGKIFALAYEGDGKEKGRGDGIARISLKCDPMLADLLRQKFASVTPGYHLNKTHWNTITCDEKIDGDEIYNQIDHSYDLIIKSLTKKARQQIEAG